MSLDKRRAASEDARASASAKMISVQPAAIAESDLYRAIVEFGPDAVICSDSSGMIRVWNRGAEAIFGYSAQEVLGKSLDVIIPAVGARYDRDGAGQARESGAGGRTCGARGVCRGAQRARAYARRGVLSDGAAHRGVCEAPQPRVGQGARAAGMAPVSR